MKNIINIFILTMFILLTNEISYAGFGLKAEVGNAVEYKTSGTYYNSTPYRYMYSDIMLNYKFKLFFIHNFYAGIRTWMIREEIKSCQPFRSIYTIGYKISYEKFYIDIQHYCNHAVYTDAMEEYWTEKNSFSNFQVTETPANQYWLSNKWGETVTTVAIGFKIGDVE